MAIRLVRAVLTDTGMIDIHGWQTQINIGLPVGLCDCGGNAEGEPIERRALSWADARCGRCGAQACRPVPSGAPLPATR